MNAPRLFLSDLSDFLQHELAADRYPDDEKGGIFRPSERAIQRIGLALEPSPKLTAWVNENNLDALWVHRPWQLGLADLPPDVGILSHHLPFDETMTLGFNPPFASKLGAINPPDPLGYKQDKDPGTPGMLLTHRPIGMTIDVAEREFDEWLHIIKAEFGGYDRAEAGHSSAVWQPTSCRIAVMGAMTDVLVREAAERGAHLYLTGSYRKPAQQAVDETGIAVIAVGHRRTEAWGLQSLAALLHEHWPVECFIHGQTP